MRRGTHPLISRLATLLFVVSMSGPLFAAAGEDSRSWDLMVEAYLWGPNVDLENADGTNTEIEFSDLAKVTEMGAMTGLYAGRGRWLVGVDTIYMDVEDNVNDPIEPGVELQKAGLKLFYGNPVVSYSFARLDRSEFRVYTGVRYLWAEYNARIRTDDPLPVDSQQFSESDSRWDAIIGLHGSTSLTDRWYVNYQADVGTGQSDWTVQFVGDVNYRFKRFDASVGYRYLGYDPDSDLFNRFDFSGFFAGAKIRF